VELYPCPQRRPRRSFLREAHQSGKRKIAEREAVHLLQIEAAATDLGIIKVVIVVTITVIILIGLDRDHLEGETAVRHLGTKTGEEAAAVRALRDAIVAEVVIGIGETKREMKEDMVVVAITGDHIIAHLLLPLQAAAVAVCHHLPVHLHQIVGEEEETTEIIGKGEADKTKDSGQEPTMCIPTSKSAKLMVKLVAASMEAAMRSPRDSGMASNGSLELHNRYRLLISR
jgi:hypothetical protein